MHFQICQCHLPSKKLNLVKCFSKFEGDEKFLKFGWTFQLFVFLDKELGEFAMGTVVVLSFGKISLTMTELIWWQLCQKEAHSVMRMMGIKIHMFLQLVFGWQLFMTGFFPLEGKNYMNAHPDINIVSINDRVLWSGCGSAPFQATHAQTYVHRYLCMETLL